MKKLMSIFVIVALGFILSIGTCLAGDEKPPKGGGSGDSSDGSGDTGGGGDGNSGDTDSNTDGYNPDTNGDGELSDEEVNAYKIELFVHWNQDAWKYLKKVRDAMRESTSDDDDGNKGGSTTPEPTLDPAPPMR